MVEERSEFEKTKSVISNLNGNGERFFLVWNFLDKEFYGFGRYNSQIDAVFVEYKDETGGSGTFVIDKDSLATDIRFLAIENKNGKETE